MENNSFKFVNSFVLNTLPNLKEIHIGDNSFEGFFRESGYQFSIINCTQLNSVSIGKGSFSQYSDVFEIRECPSLERIVLQGSNFQVMYLNIQIEIEYCDPFTIDSVG